MNDVMRIPVSVADASVEYMETLERSNALLEQRLEETREQLERAEARAEILAERAERAEARANALQETNDEYRRRIHRLAAETLIARESREAYRAALLDPIRAELDATWAKLRPGVDYGTAEQFQEAQEGATVEPKQEEET